MKALLSAFVLVLGASAQSLDDQIAQAARALQPSLVECRRDIHMHPELSNKEERTGKLIAERLRALGLEDVQTGIAGHGVTALLRGGKPGPVVAWRADMDALPIDESNFNVPYKSTVKGVKHACGHDAHITIALGIAETLVKLKDQVPGTIKFIFQPAEEGSGGAPDWGARLMIKQGVLDNPKPAAIFAFHVAGGLEVGKVSYTDGAASAASAGLTITIQGKRAHGAYPFQGIDAVAIASQCIVALQSIHSRRIDPQDPSVLSLGTIHGGDRRNVIAEKVTIAGTLRTFSDAVTDKYEAMIRQTLEGCTSAMGGSFELSLRRSYPPMMNSPSLNKLSLPVVSKIIGADNLLEVPPGMFGEDFSYYQRALPGTMFFLGVSNKAKGITASVHTAEFDIDEDSLSLGVHIGAKLLVNYLNGNVK